MTRLFRASGLFAALVVFAPAAVRASYDLRWVETEVSLRPDGKATIVGFRS